MPRSTRDPVVDDQVRCRVSGYNMEGSVYVSASDVETLDTLEQGIQSAESLGT